MKIAVSSFSLALLCAAACAQDLNVYAGRPQTLPCETKGEWRLETPSGRLVKSGNATGLLALELPPLADGVLAQDFLFLDQTGRRKLTAWSQKLFIDGFSAKIALSPELAKALRDAGLADSEDSPAAFLECGSKERAKLNFIFPRPENFPLEIDGGWTSLSVLKTKFPGRLSVLSDKDGSTLEMKGAASCAVFVDAQGAKSVVFSPDVRLDDIETMLFIKKLIQEEESKWKSSAKLAR